MSEGLNKNHVAVPTQAGTCLTFDLCSVTDDGIFRAAKTRRPIQNNGFVSCIDVDVCALTRAVLEILQAVGVIVASSEIYELRILWISVSSRKRVSDQVQHCKPSVYKRNSFLEDVS